jgi:hypothetical protein
MRELRGNDARKLLLAVTDDGGGGLVAGALDTEDQGHGSISPRRH